MENKQKIVISNRIFRRQELYKEEDDFRKKRAQLSFEDKIKILVELQRLAHTWGNKKDVFVWKI